MASGEIPPPSTSADGDEEDGTSFKDAYAPLVLYEGKGEYRGTYNLILSDEHMVSCGRDKVFEENGRYGNGYGWGDIALCAVRKSAEPEIEGKIEMDPEGGSFFARSSNIDAIRALASLLHKACHEPEYLAELVKNAPFEFD